MSDDEKMDDADVFSRSWPDPAWRKKLEGLATVQIVDSNGRVLKEGLEGVGGLANLAKVTVSGRVAEGSSPESLVVNATAIKVNP